MAYAPALEPFIGTAYIALAVVAVFNVLWSSSEDDFTVIKPDNSSFNTIQEDFTRIE